MLKNKHFIAALIITPILAVVSYFAVDAYVSEKPHVAKEGSAYPLAAKPNCRYASGQCSLQNSELKIDLVPLVKSAKTIVTLTSSHELKGARISLGSSQNPQAMQKGSSNKEWVVETQEAVIDTTAIKLAVQANKSLYFADLTGVFFKLDNKFTR